MITNRMIKKKSNNENIDRNKKGRQKKKKYNSRRYNNKNRDKEL